MFVLDASTLSVYIKQLTAFFGTGSAHQRSSLDCVLLNRVFTNDYTAMSPVARRDPALHSLSDQSLAILLTWLLRQQLISYALLIVLTQL